MKLDIACGQRTQPGFKGVDIAPGSNVDFVWDLEKFPWEPFKDNSVEEVYVSHYIEHTKDLLKFMDEVWRICKPGAIVKMVSPYYTSIRAWQDPTHTRAISENTFLYFQKKWREHDEIKLGHYPVHCDFEIIKMLQMFNEPWNSKSEETKQFAVKHYWNVIADIYVEMKAIK